MLEFSIVSYTVFILLILCLCIESYFNCTGTFYMFILLVYFVYWTMFHVYIEYFSCSFSELLLNVHSLLQFLNFCISYCFILSLYCLLDDCSYAIFWCWHCKEFADFHQQWYWADCISYSKTSQSSQDILWRIFHTWPSYDDAHNNVCN